MHKLGKLNMDEFAVAMHLIYAKLAGKDLPVTLPQELIPPSTRDLDALASFVKKDVIANLSVPKRPLARDYSAASIDLSPIGTELSRPPLDSPVQSLPNYEQKEKREDLLKIIETKRKELFEFRSKVDEQTKSSKRIENEIFDIKRDLTSLHSQTIQSSRIVDQYKSSLEKARTTILQSGGASIPQLISAASKLENELLGSLQKAKNMIEITAEKKIEAVKRKYPSQASNNLPSLIPSPSGADTDSVSSKAAALLAARMAALGVGTSKDNSQNVAQIEINKIMEEKKQHIDLLRDREVRVNNILQEIGIITRGSSLPHYSSSAVWNPKVEDQIKFEDGIGIKSAEVQSLVEDLKDISMQAKRGPPLPTIPIKQSHPSQHLKADINDNFLLNASGTYLDNSNSSSFSTNGSNSKPAGKSSQNTVQQIGSGQGSYSQYSNDRKLSELPIQSTKWEERKENNIPSSTTHGITTDSMETFKSRASFETKHSAVLQRAQEAIKFAQESTARRSFMDSPSSATGANNTFTPQTAENTTYLGLKRDNYTKQNHSTNVDQKEPFGQELTPLSPNNLSSDFASDRSLGSKQKNVERIQPKGFDHNEINASSNVNHGFAISKEENTEKSLFSAGTFVENSHSQSRKSSSQLSNPNHDDDSRRYNNLKINSPHLSQNAVIHQDSLRENDISLTVLVTK